MMETQRAIYQKMLQERFYLYRPWIPISKSTEAEVLREQKLASPILDIGCGNGLFATYYFNGKIDIGLDYNEKAIKEAKERAIYEKVILADANSLPFKDNLFRTVISICAIEHIPSLDKVLSSIYKVLNKDSKFIFTVPSDKFGELLFASRTLSLFGLKGLARKYAYTKNRRSGHIHIYDIGRWKEILNKKGFNVLSIDYIFSSQMVFLWSFFHSFIFQFLFLPFRLFRDLNIKIVDDILKLILRNLSNNIMKEGSSRNLQKGGYLLIIAKKP